MGNSANSQNPGDAGKPSITSRSSAKVADAAQNNNACTDLMQMNQYPEGQMNTAQMNLQMQNAVIGDLKFGLLDESQNQTAEIVRWKKNKKE